MKKTIVVLTGAGISAESGINTFRGAGGLWEGHRIEDVASPQGWEKDQDLVLEFYNLRRDGVRQAQPNKGHLILAELQNDYKVHIITQNIDDLHERAGSQDVLHLHGEILKARSTNPNNPEILDLGNDNIKSGDLCKMGHQLRPHIVWFGEAVPMMEKAIEISLLADIFVVVGTSLAVYPAAGLIQCTNADEKYIIDPNTPEGTESLGFKAIRKGGSEGLEELKDLLSIG